MHNVCIMNVCIMCVSINQPEIENNDNVMKASDT